jgi:hypothetical protein
VMMHLAIVTVRELRVFFPQAMSQGLTRPSAHRSGARRAFPLVLATQTTFPFMI